MRISHSLCLGVVLAVHFSIQDAGAQAQPQPVPIEIFGCNYIDGAGIEDVQEAIDSFNEWADENDLNTLNSSLLIPHFYSDQLTFDVLFLDRWRDGAAMGAGLTQLMSEEAADVIGAFDQAVDCGIHTYFAGILVSPPEERVDGGPIQFRNCTVKENRATGEGIEAIAEWAERSAEAGVSVGSGHAVFLPIAGENPNATYTFKWIVLLPSYQALGDSFDRFTANNGGQLLSSIIDPVMECDSPRYYNQTIVRSMGE